MGVLLGGVLLYPLGIAGRAFWNEYDGFGPAPAHVDSESARKELPGLLDVSWPSGRGKVAGWFVPGRERAAVVVMHGSGGDRSEMLSEVAILAKGGFSVLAFYWPGHGESTGDVEWDESERAALRGALDWLSARPEVDRDRIGAFAFSLGGIPLIQVAAVDTRVRAVALAGTPEGYVELAHWEYRKHGALSEKPALLGMRLHGMHYDEQVPHQIIGQLAPRPLLMVLGEKDVTIPPEMTRALFGAAHEPKALLTLPDAGHGEYAVHGGAVYPERLRAFFGQALLGGQTGGTQP